MKRITLLVAMLALGLLGPSLAANAGPADAGGAVLSNTLDQVGAAAEPQDPNLTCDVTAGGKELVQHESIVVGELYGQDLGVGYGECVSLDTSKSYSVSLYIRMQYYDGGWKNTDCALYTNSYDASNGVAVVPPTTRICTYSSTSAYLGKYHRARVILYTSAGVTRRAYSPVWYMDA